MSTSANCLAGYRALAARPSRGQFSSLKLYAFAFAIRKESGTQRDFYTRTLKSQEPTTDVRSLARPRPLHLQLRSTSFETTAVARYATHAAEPRDDDAELPSSPPFSSGSYANLTIGVPKESYPGERRVAITPQNVALLLST
jgi:NAD(P) transhydrogenase